MGSCGNCAHYVHRPFNEDVCSKTGKIVPFLAERDCFVERGTVVEEEVAVAPVETESKPNEEEKTKVCELCHQEKPVSAFNKAPRSKDGRRRICIECELKTRQPETTATKVCKKCGRELTLDKFGVHNRSLDGHQSICLECQHEVGKNSPKRGGWKKPEKPEKPEVKAAPKPEPKPAPKPEVKMEVKAEALKQSTDKELDEVFSKMEFIWGRKNLVLFCEMSAMLHHLCHHKAVDCQAKMHRENMEFFMAKAEQLKKQA